MNKLLTLYALMTNFVVKLDKQHVVPFLNMINTTEIGTVLVQISSKLKQEWDSAFLIVSRPDGKMYVVLVVDKEERFLQHIKVLQATRTLLASFGVELELELMANFSRTEWIPY